MRHNTPQTAPDIQRGNQYQLLENCDDDDSLEETKTPFEIELENVKLRKKADYLQHKLKILESKELNTRTNQTQNNKQTSQSEDAKASKTSSKRTDNEETRTKAKSVANDQTNTNESTKQQQFNNGVSDKKQLHNNKKTLQESENQNRKFKPKSTYIVGDSILNNVNEKLLSNKKRLVKVYSLSGATTDDLKEFLKPLAHTKPGRIILHCGTNDLRDKSTDEVIKNLVDLRLMIQGVSPDTKVIFSSLTLRLDSDESKSKVVKVNAQLKSICEHENIELVDNSNITKRGLGVEGLHLNMSGTARLALNFKSVLTKV